ncbi:hypothetical protein [Streptomyces sp. NPDC058308]|uniref:hypothetical protein n=1 Tax=Streptomyces sp. NPDC058308 TaxID=3346440 RepID=UPI0036E9AE5F
MPLVRRVGQWNLQNEGRRLRSRTRTIGESSAHERPLLRPLPNEVFETGRWFTPRVNRFGQITVRSNTYSGWVMPQGVMGRRIRPEWRGLRLWNVGLVLP